jgi:hypothetical protein
VVASFVSLFRLATATSQYLVSLVPVTHGKSQSSDQHFCFIQRFSALLAGVGAQNVMFFLSSSLVLCSSEYRPSCSQTKVKFSFN